MIHCNLWLTATLNLVELLPSISVCIKMLMSQSSVPLTIPVLFPVSLLLNQMWAGQRRVPAFLKLLLSARSVCVCACACVRVPAPEAINYIHVILNLYNQRNKFVAFRNVMKLSTHGCGLCNEARHDRNQSNKAMLAP